MSFCTGCGKPLDEQARFCTNCGTPATVVSSPIAQTSTSASPPAAPVRAREPVAAAAPEPQLLMPESGSESRVLVIVGILLFVLIVAGVGTIFYMRHQPDEKAVSKGTTTGVESGTAEAGTSGTSPNPSAGQPDPYIRNLNLGAYPGSIAIAVTDESAGEVIAAFRTRDTPQQVIGYYKIRFPVATARDEEGKSELRAALPNGKQILIQAAVQANGTEVQIIRER